MSRKLPTKEQMDRMDGLSIWLFLLGAVARCAWCAFTNGPLPYEQDAE